MENTKQVTCQICGKEFKYLPPHTAQAHGLNKEEYLEKFPDAEVGKNPAKRKKVREKIGDAHRNKDVPEETREKMSKAHKGNKQSESECVKRSKSMKKYYENNPEAREKQRKILEGFNPMKGVNRPKHSERMSGEDNPMKRPEVREKLTGEGNPFYKKKHSEESKKKMSETTKKFLRENPEKHPNRILADKNGISEPQQDIFDLLNRILDVNVCLEYCVNTVESMRVLDVALPSFFLDIEYDGDYWHNKEDDKKRDEEMREIGWVTVRIKEDGEVRTS